MSLKSVTKQPILLFCLVFTLTSFIFKDASPAFKLSALSLSVIGAVIMIPLGRFRFGIYKSAAKKIAVALTAVLFAVGVRFIHENIILNSIYSNIGDGLNITARVESIDSSNDYSAAYTVQVKSVNERKTSFKAKLLFSGEFDAETGDIISLVGSISLPEEEDFGFPLRSYYYSNGIYLTIDATGADCKTIGNERSFGGYFSELSEKLSARLKITLGKREGGFASGILLGRKNDVPSDIKRDFRFLGITHILSVSGLHLSILIGGLLTLLRALKTPRPLILIITSAAIIFMCLITGLPASAVRSGIMMFIFILAGCVGRKEDPLQSLFIASASILLFSPESVSDVGFMLSFASTLGIITLGKELFSTINGKIKGKDFLKKALRSLTVSLSVTLSASIFTLPILYLNFGEISVFAPIANLIVVPFSGVMLFLSVGTVIFRTGLLAGIFGGAAGSLSSFIIDISSELAKIAPEPISLRYDFTKLCFVIAALSLLSILFIKKRNILVCLIPFIAFAVSFSAFYAANIYKTKNETSVIAVNLKKNDFLLVKRDGKTLICDFSDGTYTQSKRAAALVSEELYDTSPDAVLLTHLHRYHAVTLRKLAENNRISYVIIPEPYDEKSKDAFDAITDLCEETGIKAVIYPSSEKTELDFSGVKITLSEIELIDRSVQPINLLSIKTEEKTISYIGSAAFESELSKDAQEIASDSDILWYGIHGPKIKEKPPQIFTSGNVFVSSDAVNQDYGYSFDVINDGKRYFMRLN